MPSTKPPGEKSNATAELADRPWDVKLHREVAKTIAKSGGEDAPAFVPTIRDLKNALASDPKQYPKKSGKLKDARAAHVRFADGVEWVAVYEISETKRSVRVLSLGPHDRAYGDAEKRI
jgi:mRNA-degrading endonuclease YafQ of YafQ-DinJ toxin-antitoxin module